MLMLTASSTSTRRAAPGTSRRRTCASAPGCSTNSGRSPASWPSRRWTSPSSSRRRSSSGRQGRRSRSRSLLLLFSPFIFCSHLRHCCYSADKPILICEFESCGIILLLILQRSSTTSRIKGVAVLFSGPKSPLPLRA